MVLWEELPLGKGMVKLIGKFRDKGNTRKCMEESGMSGEGAGRELSTLSCSIRRCIAIPNGKRVV